MERKRPEVELATVSRDPYNAETPLPALLDEVTASDLVYVRNHFNVPQLELSEWTLQISGSVKSPQSMTFVELKGLPAKSIRMTMECAGNGRKSMVPMPAGTPWGHGAVSIVDFTGTPVSEVLEAAGYQDRAEEVVFHGADGGEVVPGRNERFVRSLPIEVALDPDTLLAWEMNGQPLSPNHGFPVRLVVPNWYGMASVKWLTEINVSLEPYSGFFQNEHYVYSGEEGTPEGKPVQRMRVRSLILDAAPNAASELEVVGIAWSGDASIAKVEISADGGNVWHAADLDQPNSKYDIQRWRTMLNHESEHQVALISRATDAAGHVQPIANRWNQGGYGNNGLHAFHFQPQDSATAGG